MRQHGFTREPGQVFVEPRHAQRLTQHPCNRSCRPLQKQTGKFVKDIRLVKCGLQHVALHVSPSAEMSVLGKKKEGRLGNDAGIRARKQSLRTVARRQSHLIDPVIQPVRQRSKCKRTVRWFRPAFQCRLSHIPITMEHQEAGKLRATGQSTEIRFAGVCFRSPKGRPCASVRFIFGVQAAYGLDFLRDLNDCGCRQLPDFVLVLIEGIWCPTPFPDRFRQIDHSPAAVRQEPSFVDGVSSHPCSCRRAPYCNASYQADNSETPGRPCR